MFRRRSNPEQTAGLASEQDTTEGQPTRKGRPTPTRREAEQARKQRVKPPLTRREALRRERELARTQRVRTRQAMVAGD